VNPDEIMAVSSSERQQPHVGWVTRFLPGLIRLLKYQPTDFRFDLVAGVSVAAVALPVGIAYSEIAGVPPIYGIYSALVPLLVYALLGSSKQLIVNPDAATCLMVAAAIAPLAGGDPARYLQLMILLTVMTGTMSIVFGLLRFGFLANFLSNPILIGYLNGVALLILVGQLPKLFGYHSEAGDISSKVVEFFRNISKFHLPTLALGLTAIGALIALKRFLPRLPGALIVAAGCILAVFLLKLQERGVAVLGAVPSGLPSLHLPDFGLLVESHSLLRAAAGISVIGFISGILTCKSFARRNKYDVDANQELVAFGACSLASGLVQGFPVTGADSRTAVNNDMGGRTQMVGLVAAGTIVVFLLFLTAPLGLLPTAALAAIVAVASLGLFDFAALRDLYAASRRELMFCLVTTIAVLYFGVLEAVFFAVMLTFLWLLMVASKPRTAILGRVSGLPGLHSLSDYPNAQTVDGLILFRFESNLLFFNIDYLKERLLEEIAKSPTPVEWVVIDASPVSLVDLTALTKIMDLRDHLQERGIRLGFAAVRRSVMSSFKSSWLENHPRLDGTSRFPTVKSAIKAFVHRNDLPPAVASTAE
jgi:high affinity sulfate transporter 1